MKRFILFLILCVFLFNIQSACAVKYKINPNKTNKNQTNATNSQSVNPTPYLPAQYSQESKPETQDYTQSTAQTGSAQHYIQDNITPQTMPELGISPTLMQPQEDEIGMEIVWNQWRANVGNNVFSQVWRFFGGADNILEFLLPQAYDYSMFAYYTVHSDRKISNIVILCIPERSLTTINKYIYIKPNSIMYVYSLDKDKYYTAYLKGMKHYSISDLLSDYSYSIFTKIVLNDSPSEVPYTFRNYMESSAREIKKKSYENFLKFPSGTKRESVVSVHGLTDISWAKSGKYYSADDFNDTEKR